MANLRDMIRRALNGRSPEDALAEFKEKLHAQINDFKDDPASRARLQQYLRSVLTPLQYFNAFVVKPNLNDNDRLREMAKRYNVNKVELKRVLKVALELEEKVQGYFEDNDRVDQLVITLRKVINVLDEQILTDLIDAMDYNIDYGKIEKAYLDYQSTLQKAYNVDGLNRDLQGIMGTVMNNLKNAFTQGTQQTRSKPSDRQPEVRMLDPQLQNLYNHFREEGYDHNESMDMVNERRDVDGLKNEFLEAYRTLRQEGKSHQDAMHYVQSLQDKASSSEADA